MLQGDMALAWGARSLALAHTQSQAARRAGRVATPAAAAAAAAVAAPGHCIRWQACFGDGFRCNRVASTSLQTGVPTASSIRATADLALGDGGGVVRFGKYLGDSYQQVIANDPEYCHWIVRTADKDPDRSDYFVQFADFCRVHLPIGPLSSDSGPVAKADPDYRAFGRAAADGSIDLAQPQSAPEARADAVLSFGRYKGETMLSVVEGDPDYCQWVVAQAAAPDASPCLVSFASFVKEGRLERSPPNVVGFGRHRGKTYEDVLEEDPDYCQWVMRRVALPGASPRLVAWSRWLSEAGVQKVERDPQAETVGFGMYRKLTLKELVDRDPYYARWICDLSQEPEPRPAIKRIGDALISGELKAVLYSDA